MAQHNKENSRRQFIKSAGIAAAGLALLGGGVGYYNKVNGPKFTRQPRFLRPPGAIDEETFIYACIKCGLCVQICPVEAIKLADLNKGLDYGTPYIDVREQACDFSCDSLQCVETCPTAVLDFTPFELAGGEALKEYSQTHDATKPGFNPFSVQIIAMKSIVKMGIAKVNKETCLAHKGEGFNGTPRGNDFDGIYRSPNSKTGKPAPLSETTFDREICDLCVTECPIGEKAIVMSVDSETGKTIPQVLEGCTGCGVCVMVCPTQKESIIIEPIKEESHV